VWPINVVPVAWKTHLHGAGSYKYRIAGPDAPSQVAPAPAPPVAPPTAYPPPVAWHQGGSDYLEASSASNHHHNHHHHQHHHHHRRRHRHRRRDDDSVDRAEHDGSGSGIGGGVSTVGSSSASTPGIRVIVPGDIPVEIMAGPAGHSRGSHSSGYGGGRSDRAGHSIRKVGDWLITGGH
jgi:hypothetical protein